MVPRAFPRTVSRMLSPRRSVRTSSPVEYYSSRAVMGFIDGRRLTNGYFRSIVATMQRCVNCRPRDWDRRPRGEIAKSTGGFFFVWTLWALGALGGVTFVLSARGTTAHRSRHDPTRRRKMRRGAARLPGQAGIARPFRRMG